MESFTCWDNFPLQLSGVVKQLFFTCSPLYCCACKTNARWWKKPPKIFVKNDCDYGFDDDAEDDGDDKMIRMMVMMILFEYAKLAALVVRKKQGVNKNFFMGKLR